MAADCEPSISNVETMKNTFIKYAQGNNLRNTYDFLIYHGMPDIDDIADPAKCTFVEEDAGHDNGNVYRIIVPAGDYIYRTFEKTHCALEYIGMLGLTYDLYVRINISSYINIHMLDRFADKFDENIVYCNAINAIVGDDRYLNDLCPRGDFYIFSEKVRKGIVNEGHAFNCIIRNGKGMLVDFTNPICKDGQYYRVAQYPIKEETLQEFMKGKGKIDVQYKNLYTENGEVKEEIIPAVYSSEEIEPKYFEEHSNVSPQSIQRDTQNLGLQEINNVGLETKKLQNQRTTPNKEVSK